MYVCLLLKFDFQKCLCYNALKSLFLSFFYLAQVTFLKEEKDNQQKEVNKANQPKETPKHQEIVFKSQNQNQNVNSTELVSKNRLSNTKLPRMNHTVNPQ